METIVEKRGIVIPSVLFIVTALLMLLKELPLVSGQESFHIYLIGRFFFIAALGVCILMAFLEVRWIYKYYSIVFYLLSLVYECHGQIFQPNYWLAYIQITTIFPFIFHLNRKLLITLLSSGLFTFDLVFYLTSKKWVGSGAFTKELFIDILSGTVISTVIAYTGADIFIAEKIKRNQLYQRFIDLGKNISSIVHDIKGMISGPCTYVDILSEKVRNGEVMTEYESEIVNYLRQDVSSIRDFVMEMNLLVSSHITERENPVSVSTVVQSVKKVFKAKIRNIRVELVGDMTLMIKVDYLNRILINSIVNACEAINKNSVKDGRVLIYCEDNFLGVADNSGEHLSPKLLKILNSPYTSFSSKAEGSGLGILLIKDYITAIDGKYRYSNHAAGVDLKMTFPKKIVLKTVNR